MKITAQDIIKAKILGGDGGGLKVDSLTIDKNPTKTTYFVGETLDLSGLVVNATVGSLSGEVTKDCTFSPAEGTIITPDTGKVTVKYGNMTADIELSLNQPLALYVTTPTKMNYLVGDTLDLTGIQVMAEYKQIKKSNPMMDVTEYCSFSPANGTVIQTSGMQTITASFLGLTGTTSVMAFDITEIDVTTMPTKTQYQNGDTFDLTGIEVTGYAAGGSLSKVITSECTFSPASGSTISAEDGTYQCTVSYNGLTDTFDYVVSSIPATLQECTWSQISDLVKSGKFTEHFHTGDTKTVTVDGSTYTLVAHVNDGTGSAGTYYPANTVDFLINNPNKTMKMGPDVNTCNKYVHDSCIVRSYCLNTIYANLPSDLKSAIVAKNHMIYGDYQSPYQVLDKVWIPTPIEFGYTATGYINGIKTVDNNSYSKRYDMFSTTQKLYNCMANIGNDYVLWSCCFCRGVSASQGNYMVATTDYKGNTLNSERSGASGIYQNATGNGVLWGFRIG